jgi:hypothetical protein
MKLALALLFAVALTACSAQSMTPETPHRTLHTQGTTPNSGGTTDGNNSANPTASPTPMKQLPGETAIAVYEPTNGCDARYYECIGGDFLQCAMNCVPRGVNIATFPAANRDTCWGSPAQVGFNLPIGAPPTSGNTITNIHALFAKGLGGYRPVVGFIYTTREGNNFFQEDPTYSGDFLMSILSAIPATNPVASMIKDNSKGVSPALTPEQLAELEKGLGGAGGAVESCFSAPLG